MNTYLNHAWKVNLYIPRNNVKWRELDMIPGFKMSPAWSHYLATAADRKQLMVLALRLPELSALRKTHILSPWSQHGTHPHSCKSSVRTDSCPNTEYSNCVLPRSSIFCKRGWVYSVCVCLGMYVCVCTLTGVCTWACVCISYCASGSPTGH